MDTSDENDPRYLEGLPEYWANRLRGYQRKAIHKMREEVRRGAKRVMICAPTGAGKTEIAACLLDLARSKKEGNRATFLVDRVSLVDQSSRAFDRHGIDHGIYQADNPRWIPYLPVQVCSAQTVERRGWPESTLLIVDEAHSLREKTTEHLLQRSGRSLGLSATPFKRGLGDIYDAIVNVTTTNRLIEQGFLAPYRIFSCTAPDMEGVKVVAGEYERKEAEKRALQVVGDVVQEYLAHGENRKFICSAVDTSHVMELQRQFLAAGINAATYTYKDHKEDRPETLREFCKTDSTIKGLITVTAASKGFDCPDIGCVIMARPLRKSLEEHIQFFGRGLRIADGKVDCIVLDHSGNCARFWKQWNDVFQNGVSVLLKRKAKETEEQPREKQDEPPEMVTCPNCKHIHPARPHCPNCGFEYPKRTSVQHVPGSLKELLGTGTPKQVTQAILPQLIHHARQKWGADWVKKTKWMHFLLTARWPDPEAVLHTKPIKASPELLGRVGHAIIKDRHARAAEQRRSLKVARTAPPTPAPQPAEAYGGAVLPWEAGA